MNNKTTVIAVVGAIILVGIGAIAFATRNNSMNNNMSTDTHSMDDGHHADDKQQPTSSTVETNQVTYKSFAVVQETIKVKKGTTVTWTNEDTAKHDVTPEKETDEFKTSKLFGKGETYSVTFNTVGTFAYYCSPHPYMKGTVEVTE